MKKYALKPRVQIVPLEGDELILFRKGAPSVKLRVSQHFMQDLAHLLVNGFTAEQLSAALALNTKAVEKLITQLQSATILAEVDEALADEKYQRLAAYLEGFASMSAGQTLATLQNRRVCLLGVGGLGSYIFQHLIANGIRHIQIVDDDRVQRSNLSRQTLYTEANVGQLKVEAAKQWAATSGVEVSIIVKRLESVADILQLWEQEKPDLVISTIDEPVLQITRMVVQAAERRSIPLLRANSRAVGPFYIPGHTSCPACLSFDIGRNIKSAQSVVQSYQQGFPARRRAAISYELAFVGLLVIRDVLHYLAGTGSPQTLAHEWSWDPEQFTLNSRHVQRQADCPGCGGKLAHDLRSAFH
jgi:molybdopterin/thiamine biosynthesis adenylyltransferase